MVVSRRDLVICVCVSLFWVVVFHLTGSFTTSEGISGGYKPTTLHHEDKIRSISELPVLETPQTVTLAKQNDDEKKETVHVLFALSGKHPGFLGEFEVAMKSILLNAPLDAPLTIHVMADLKAYNALPEVYNRTEIQTWRTRQPVEIRSYNVQPKIADWILTLKKALNGTRIHARHTIGAYFRLFNHHVVDQDVKHVLYLDTDAVVMANLGELWTHINPDSLFTWGRTMCSGFMVLNVDKMEQVWNLISNLDLTGKGDDQSILVEMNRTYPQNISLLPPAWDISVGNVWREAHGGILKARPEAGMLHFNGGGSGPESWFLKHGMALDPGRSGNFGLAQYYARLPWTWARFMAKSQIEVGEGYQLQIKYNSNTSATR